MSNTDKVIVFWDHVHCYPPPAVNRIFNGASAIRKIIRAIGKLGLGSVTQFIVFLDVVEDSQKGAFAAFHKKPVTGGVMLVHCPSEGDEGGYTSGKRMADELQKFAAFASPPATIVALTGDQAVNPVLSYLHRQGFNVIAIFPDDELKRREGIEDGTIAVYTLQALDIDVCGNKSRAPSKPAEQGRRRNIQHSGQSSSTASENVGEHDTTEDYAEADRPQPHWTAAESNSTGTSASRPFKRLLDFMISQYDDGSELVLKHDVVLYLFRIYPDGYGIAGVTKRPVYFERAAQAGVIEVDYSRPRFISLTKKYLPKRDTMARIRTQFGPLLGVLIDNGIVARRGFGMDPKPLDRKLQKRDKMVYDKLDVRTIEEYLRLAARAGIVYLKRTKKTRDICMVILKMSWRPSTSTHVAEQERDDEEEDS